MELVVGGLGAGEVRGGELAPRPTPFLPTQQFFSQHPSLARSRQPAADGWWNVPGGVAVGRQVGWLVDWLGGQWLGLAVL